MLSTLKYLSMKYDGNEYKRVYWCILVCNQKSHAPVAWRMRQTSFFQCTRSKETESDFLLLHKVISQSWSSFQLCLLYPNSTMFNNKAVKDRKTNDCKEGKVAKQEGLDQHDTYGQTSEINEWLAFSLLVKCIYITWSNLSEFRL